MDSTKVLSLLDQLDDDVDDLEEVLAPLLKTVLSETSSKLPLLDKAKLYVLVTYAIESVLFSYLRLNGVNAREHPVFLELTRVKQYFDKIKKAEFPPERTVAVDRKAAARFIKAGLAGNDKYDLERAEQLAKERAKAHIKFEDISREIAKKRKAEAAAQQQDKDVSDSSDSESESPINTPETKPSDSKKKKRKIDSAGSLPNSGSSTPQREPKKKNRTSRNRKTSKDA